MDIDDIDILKNVVWNFFAGSGLTVIVFIFFTVAVMSWDVLFNFVLKGQLQLKAMGIVNSLNNMLEFAVRVTLVLGVATLLTYAL